MAYITSGFFFFLKKYKGVNISQSIIIIILKIRTRQQLLGSKTLETKCIRTSFCICWQTMIKTMSLGLGLLKVYLLLFESS